MTAKTRTASGSSRERELLAPTARANEAVELGLLLAEAIGSVAQAQARMDAYTEKRREAYEAAEAGSLVLPPLWYVFSKVAVELELSASVTRGPARPEVMCRTLNPTAVGLYGHTAAAGLRVRVQLEPQGVLPIKQTQTAAARDPAETP